VARLGEETADEDLTIEGKSDKQFVLGDCSPNPFDFFTTISCSLPDGTTSGVIVIRSIDGKIIQTLPINGSGDQKVLVHKAGLSSGIYFYSLETNGLRWETKRMIIQ